MMDFTTGATTNDAMVVGSVAAAASSMDGTTETATTTDPASLVLHAKNKTSL